MANDMSLFAFDKASKLDCDMTLIAFDEASKLDWFDLSSFPEPASHIPKDFFIRPLPKNMPKEYPEYKEYIITNVDIGTLVANNIENITTFNKMRDIIYKDLYEQQYAYLREVKPKKKICEMFKVPSDWIQKTLSKYRNGKTARCILGALMEKWSMQGINMPRGDFNSDAFKIAHYIKKNYPEYSQYRDDTPIIARWNDTPDRTFQDIKNMLEVVDV